MQRNGFTLIEIIIAIAIIAILSLIAAGVYVPYALKSRRSDAINVLLSISMAEERYRSNNTQYGTLAQVWSGVTTSPQGYYTLSITNVTTTGYTITATGIGNQANDSEGSTSCSPMQLTLSSGTTTQTPTACWPS
ncbi:MAG: type IV pilin protein [Gammaproteobacteria bacterium]|nr:type IV pilin protein [Gammaproteobacteria bacterium]